ncbi:TerD family protein [Streptomyces sp. NBC_00249]|uniref:TerD family protein n=1 Tax=Streptomyces sp. NBC_00249 TaxID=2975690 RepID=UPI0022537568|nr:TerD family protein [Streptomyces sp. NBC_00249]MCX5195729.1 TerD family protein [Streptomyces sp. NBC_00249]
MTIMFKGANAPLPGGPFRITVVREDRPGAPLVAAVAVLVDAVGRVRGEGDVVRGDRPSHPSGAVRYLGGAAEGGRLVQRLEVDEEAVEPAVQRVLIAVLASGGTFVAVAGLSVEVAGGEGPLVVRYEVTDAGGETALVLGECYRRNGAWRFRAVGQGYRAGPAALAADHGIPLEALPAAPVPGPAMTEVHKEAAPPAGVLPVGSPAAVGGGSVAARGAQLNAQAASLAASLGQILGSGAGPEQGAVPVPDGELFHEVHGEGEQVLSFGRPAPEGPLIIEMSVAGGGPFGVATLDRDDAQDQVLFDTTAPVREARALAVRGKRALLLRVVAAGAWTLRVLSLGAARRLEGTVSGAGPDVLLHEGPAADLTLRHHGPRSARFEAATAQLDRVEPDRRKPLADDDGRAEATHQVTAGPLLVLVSAQAGWSAELTPAPGHHRTPQEAERALTRSLATGVHEGRGTLELTVVNPEPGRPAVVEFERTRVPKRHSWFWIWRLDEKGEVEQLSIYSTTRDARGQMLAFAKGEPEVRVRVQGSGDWRLRVRPIDTVEALGRRAKGRGQAVLRYAGPPALIRATCEGSDEAFSYVHTVQPDGTSDRVGRFGTLAPMTGPLAVGPEGWCHVVVKLDHAASWKLEVLPLGEVRELKRKLSGQGWELVEMTGSAAQVEVRVDPGAESDAIVLATMDAYLRPERQLCGEPGVHLVPPGLIGVRTAEKWSLKVRR